jgi:dCTP deaminase
VGTPDEGAQLICFVDGKSTKARTGILVHFTAPTIHAGWHGNIVLEIANLGPFTFVLQEDDVIAQVTVATISSIPERTQKEAGSQTLGQANVKGQPPGP